MYHFLIYQAYCQKLIVDVIEEKTPYMIKRIITFKKKQRNSNIIQI
jgi:hypothetical protein